MLHTEWAVMSVMCINHKMLSNVVSLIFHFQFMSLNNRCCVRCVPCSLVEVCQYFRGFCCLHHHGRQTCYSLWSIWCLFVNQFMFLYIYPVCIASLFWPHFVYRVDVLQLWYFGFTLITDFYQILICSASIYDIVSSLHVKFWYHWQCYCIVNVCP